MDLDLKFNIMIVDDDALIYRSLARHYYHHPYRLFFAPDGYAALEHLSRSPVSLMIIDLKMPGMDGMDVLQKALQRQSALKVIMFSGHGNIRDAVAAIQLGAIDFFEKSVSLDLLDAKIAQIYQMCRLEHENRKVAGALAPAFAYEDLHGNAPAMLQLKSMILRIAPTDASVLIQGESGTGKELVARAIHRHSDRSDKPFMPVDCASISESVMESELFGHRKGAFTGALESTQGLIRAADGGTLFLDEIGELPMTMQAKLLRTIQERVVRPVGAVRAISVDIRILSATNRNLIEAVAQGGFRKDLYYRLSGVTLPVPPLRERGDDIALISSVFLEKIGKEAMPAKSLSQEALQRLQSHSWPGNVRELENTLQRAVVFATTNTIGPGDLDLTVPPSQQPPAQGMALGATGSLTNIEENAIRNALTQTNGNRREAAKILEISEATLYRRIRQYGL